MLKEGTETFESGLARVVIDEEGHNEKPINLYGDFMTREEFFKCIDDEQEATDEMPDEMWKKIESAAADGDREFFQKLVRLTIKLTKDGIKNRFKRRVMFGRTQRR